MADVHSSKAAAPATPAGSSNSTWIVVIAVVIGLLLLIPLVLVTAMTSIAFLGFFPGLASDAKAAQSDQYWRGEARPFAILESVQTGEKLAMTIMNVAASPIQLEEISVSGSGAGGSYRPAADRPALSPGERRDLLVGMSAPCPPGGKYGYFVNFTYSNAESTIRGQREYGSKALVGKCA